MLIVVNPGANLSAATVEHYGITVAPQRIVVDGKEHDTRDGIALGDVDRWVSSSREFPHVVGTTALEFTQIFTQLAQSDREILAVMSSRKIIQSHAAATSAARALASRAAFAHVEVAVVDTAFTDVATGLMAIAAGEAMRAGIGLKKTVDMLEAMIARTRLTFVVATLDNLVKGGRAGFLRAWLANFLDVKPVLGMTEGELKSVGRIRSKTDPVEALVADLGSVGRGKRVWVGITHGGVPRRAERLLTTLRSVFDVAYALVAPLSSSIYLHTGPGTICGTVIPIDGLPWTPRVPPDFSISG